MSDRAPHDEPIERLYRSGAGEQPPAALDRHILDAAAAAGRNRQAGRRHLRAGAGFATAAVVVLAVTLLLRQQQPLPAADRAPSSGGGLAADAVTEKRQAGPGDEAADPREPLDRIMLDADRPVSGFALGAAPAAPAPAVERAVPLHDTAAPGESGVEVGATGCAEAYAVPSGTLIRVQEGRLTLTRDGRTRVLHCDAGSWRLEPLPAAAEPHSEARDDDGRQDPGNPAGSDDA